MTTTGGPSSQTNLSIDRVLTEITSTNNISALNQTLRGFTPKDARESILSSLLPGGQDPLGVLDIQRNTLGILYILYGLDLVDLVCVSSIYHSFCRSARFLSSSTLLPQLQYVENFCRNFDIAQASLAPDRSKYIIPPTWTLLTKPIVTSLAKSIASVAENMNLVSQPFYTVGIPSWINRSQNLL